MCCPFAQFACSCLLFIIKYIPVQEVLNCCLCTCIGRRYRKSVNFWIQIMFKCGPNKVFMHNVLVPIDSDCVFNHSPDMKTQVV